MIYSHDKKIGFLDLDGDELMRATAIIKYINDASWYSAESLGAGMHETLKFGMVFILQRLAFKTFRGIKLDDLLTIKTWPSEMSRSAFIRNGEMINERGEKVLEWESMWVLIDIEKRKIKRPTDSPTQFPLYGRNDVEITTKKVRIPDDAKLAASYNHTVMFSELDMYGHMNSAIYADLVANVVKKAHLKSNPVEFQFNYINEATLDDEILVELFVDESSIFACGTSKGATVFAAQLT